MPDEYIKRSDALLEIESIPKGNWSSKRFFDAIEAVPAADVEPVRHGRWIQSTEECGWSELECAECSECAEDYVLDEWGYEDFSKFMNYCPNCGAKMDKEEDHENRT